MNQLELPSSHYCNKDTFVNEVFWPDLTFGPVNLWTVAPAWWFYMSKEKQNENIKSILTY